MSVLYGGVGFPHLGFILKRRSVVFLFLLTCLHFEALIKVKGVFRGLDLNINSVSFDGRHIRPTHPHERLPYLMKSGFLQPVYASHTPPSRLIATLKRICEKSLPDWGCTNGTKARKLEVIWSPVIVRCPSQFSLTCVLNHLRIQDHSSPA